MALRPTVADFVTWRGLPTPSPGSPEESAVNEAFETALDDIEERLRAEVIPDDPADYPRRVRLAVLLQANRLYKRRTSPEGTAGTVQFGAVPLADYDSDVMFLIERDLRMDGFF